MERFKRIDWNPALEDLIDDVFIRDERMEHESAMYRLMNGVFQDPLKDIESEYADVNIELIKSISPDVFEDTVDAEKKNEQETKNGDNNSVQNKEKNKRKSNMLTTPATKCVKKFRTFCGNQKTSTCRSRERPKKCTNPTKRTNVNQQAPPRRSLRRKKTNEK